MVRIGYKKGLRSEKGEINSYKNRAEIINLVDAIEVMSSDSALTAVGLKQDELDLDSKHQMLRISFESRSGITLKRMHSLEVDSFAKCL